MRIPSFSLTSLLFALPGLAPVAAGQQAAERHPLYEPAAPMAKERPAGELATGAVGEFIRLPYGQPPVKELLRPALKLSGWRGERVSGQAAAWSRGGLRQLTVSCSGLANSAGRSIPAAVGMVRYAKAGDTLQADIMGRETACDMPAGGVRPIWVQVDIPADAEPGVYAGAVSIRTAHTPAQQVPVEVTVEPETLPPPSAWQLHLDLWQHPQAVARWHGVEPWSPEHFALLKPLMQRLAAAGQKAITCSIIDEAWNGQTYDFFPSMIQWTKGRDGRMRYDYAAFDAWVAFMTDEIGIDGQISCYTMIPWNMKIRCYNEAAGAFEDLPLRPGEASFAKIWGHFLEDFRAHAKEKGWLDKMCIALDERPDAMLKAAKEVLDRHAPEFRIVSAVDAPTAETEEVYDLSPVLQHAGSVTPELLARRRAAGQKTTFYVCMQPLKPNTFTASPLAEAEWLGLFAAANHLDGFLRWAYNSWNRNPFQSTDFNSAGNWSPGDCFLVYPGNLSSLRFESLRDGLEDFEKINLLRAKAKESASPEMAEAIRELDAGLAELFTIPRSQGTQHADDVRKARELIRQTAKRLRQPGSRPN